MKKNIIQDVLPPKRTIRNVELHGRSKDHNTELGDEFASKVNINRSNSKLKPEEETPIKIETSVPKEKNIGQPVVYDYDYETPNKRIRWGLYFSVGFLVLALAFAISAFFRSAQVKITPQETTKSLSETFTAKKDVLPNNLSFQVVSISKETEKIVDQTDTVGEEKVERKAGGKIVIYNNYSAETQKLVATTRFQTPEGLIFRIKDPVVVPGRTTKDGKIVPGSIEAYVEADKSGPSYNTGLKDFTIPGFKGDPRFKDVYARSKTEMIGGFSGMQRTVSKEVLTRVEDEMKSLLMESAKVDLVNQIPADFILFPNTISYKFDPAVQSILSSGQVVIKKKGTASAVIFDRANLTKIIQARILPESGTDIVRISNMDKFEFSYLATTTPISSSISSITFSLNGEPNFVWTFDESKLKSDLLGLSKKSAKAVISTYPSIKEAWILTRPFWNQKIPKSLDDVSLVNTSIN
ncbi:MAG: hypothetical protein WAX44_03450 [Minisyncoccia bacterium]